MNRSIKLACMMKVLAVLTVLVVCQVVTAQSTGDEPGIPQWVIDRQQYETTFVWPQTDAAQFIGVKPGIPQWVIDRQQYETTFVWP